MRQQGFGGEFIMSEYMEECNDCGKTDFKTDMIRYWNIKNLDGRIVRMRIDYENDRIRFFFSDIGLTQEEFKVLTISQRQKMLEDFFGRSCESLKQEIIKLEEDNPVFEVPKC